MFPTCTNESKTGLTTGNGIIQAGNGMISPTSWAPIKNFFYKMFFAFTNESKTGFEKRI